MNKYRQDVTKDRLQELLSYDAETGIFRRRQGPKRGAIAGGRRLDGYIQINVDGVLYLAHRLAWLYVHGRWPIDQLDHINGARDANRIANLREATNAENKQNMSSHKDSSSQKLGVSFNRERGKWIANIQVNGLNRYLGRFDSEDAAAEAYAREKARLHSFQPTPRGNSHA